ncbi:MAG: DUF2232 domain-containing protein [bacterium]|nr:MAG: DUF2232 domain-containing protein [bacterium]
MNGQGRKVDTGLWLRLVGFALIPLTVQAFQPAVGGALGILTPLPLAYLTARRGAVEGTAAVSLVAVLSGLVLSWAQGIYFLLETLPLCIGIRWVVEARNTLYRPVMLTVGLVALTGLVAVGGYGLYAGLSPAELYRETVQNMGLFMESVSDTSGLGPQELQQVQWLLDIWQRLFIGIWTSTLLLLVTFYALLIRGWMLAAGALVGEGLVPLSRWRLPFPFVAVFIVLSTLVLTAGGLARDVALNALLPLGTLYGLQGVVVVGHLFTRWALPPFFRALALAFGIITFPVVVMTAVALMGLFDTWIDFRRRWPLAPEPPAPPMT